MPNIIFGSGIVGLMAKRILSGNWTIVPFSKSRYYSFAPPLADNFISRDKEIDEPINEMTGSNDIGLYKRCYSDNGRLITSHNDTALQLWLFKIFGDKILTHAQSYFSQRLSISVYKTHVSTLYSKLQEIYLPELKLEANKGAVTEIGPHYFMRGSERVDFDNAITTIPLSAMCKLARVNVDLHAKNEYLTLVQSKLIDLEGSNQSFVVDNIIDFYKVTEVSRGFYLFHFLSDIKNIGAYLLPIINNADIIDGTMIAESIPSDDIPDLSWLENWGIYSIGSHAQWDWCADVGSNLLRLVRYAKRGYKPA